MLPSKAESSNPATRPTIPNITQESQLFVKLKNPPTQAVNSDVEVEIRKLPGNSVQLIQPEILSEDTQSKEEGLQTERLLRNGKSKISREINNDCIQIIDSMAPAQLHGFSPKISNLSDENCSSETFDDQLGPFERYDD